MKTIKISKVKISNDRLWEIAQTGHNIDHWLREHVGYGNWKELYSADPADGNLPYRTFSFKEEKDEVMFVLKWL